MMNKISRKNSWAFAWNDALVAHFSPQYQKHLKFWHRKLLMQILYWLVFIGGTLIFFLWMLINLARILTYSISNVGVGLVLLFGGKVTNSESGTRDYGIQIGLFGALAITLIIIFGLMLLLNIIFSVIQLRQLHWYFQHAPNQYLSHRYQVMKIKMVVGLIVSIVSLFLLMWIFELIIYLELKRNWKAFQALAITHQTASR